MNKYSVEYCRIKGDNVCKGGRRYLV